MPLVNNVIDLDTDNDYWFVRTDSGDNFQTFFDNKFIGIGWNDITIGDIRTKTEREVKAKIERIIKEEAAHIGRQLTNQGIRTKTSDVYNKIVKFESLRNGDIVLIPSESSQLLAFGKIIDDRIYTAEEGANNCLHVKRRKVQWLTGPISINRLDPTFYKIRKSRHSISNINDYDYYIDSVLYGLYTKGEKSHLVIRVDTNQQINLLKLAEVLSGMHKIMSIANDAFELGENIDESSIRINLQSPGLGNIAQLGKALILAALMLGTTSCNLREQPDATKRKIEQVRQAHSQEIENTLDSMRSLGIRI